MGMKEVTHGRDVVLLWTDNTDKRAKSFGLAKSCTFEVKCGYKETQNPLTGGAKTFLPQATEWSASVSGLLCFENHQLLELCRDRTPIHMEFAPGNVVGYQGWCYVESVSVTGSVKELATYSLKLKGNGELTQRDID